MKVEISKEGVTKTRRMSEEDAAKWRHDFIAYGQAFSKEVDGVDVYVPYEDVVRKDVDQGCFLQEGYNNGERKND